MSAANAQTDSPAWKQLPSVPDPVGFAAPFAGVSVGALVVGGGANFPDAMPWAGGRKVWHDSIFVLPKPDAKWLSGFKLPRAAGAGITVVMGEMRDRGTSLGVAFTLCAGTTAIAGLLILMIHLRQTELRPESKCQERSSN